MNELELAVSEAQRVLALKSFPLFEELTPSHLAVVAQVVRPRFFPAGAELLAPGLPVRRLHFVIHGSVEILHRGKPGQVVGSHGVVGGLALLAREPARERATAVEDTVTLELDSDSLEEVFEDNFSILSAVLRVLAREQIRTRRRIAHDAGFAGTVRHERELDVDQLGLVERILWLRRTLDFAGTRIEALADLAQEAKVVALSAGDLLWEEDAGADHAVIVLRGRIAASCRDRSFEFGFEPGALLGAAEAVSDQPRWYSARAEQDTLLLRLDTETIFDVIEDHLEVATQLLRSMARTTRHLHERVSHLDPEQPIA